MPGLFQDLCWAIVSLSILASVLRTSAPGRFLRRFLLVALAAWIGEDSLMRAHEAYSYAPAWRGFVDRTPVLVPFIWPVVVHSAWELAKRLAPGASATRTAAVVGLLVVTDAAFIEPIAVRAGLWSWTYE